MTFDPAAFVDDFREEAGEYLRTLDAQLLKLERNPSDPAPVREMLLAAHTIKGSAAMVTLADVAELAHAVEDVLAHLRDEHRQLDRETADLLFQGVDMLRVMIRRATPGTSVPDPARASLAAAVRRRIQDGAEMVPRSVAAARAAAGVSETSPHPAEAPRILVVEDSTTVRMLVMMQLSDAGYRVEASADGEQALAIALEGAYDLVVASNETRSLRGLDLAAALRATPSYCDVPIIFLSSDDNPEHRQRAAEVGIQAYIRKGSPGQWRLVETVRELLSRPAAHRRGGLA
jgi:chemotaxis protein histidine kinase CheA